MSANHVVSNPGFALQEGKILQDLLQLKGLDFKGAITATVGGTQSTSIPLVSGVNRITVSANDSDGVLLPPASAGAVVLVKNADAAQAVKVFARSSDTINGVAGSTGVTLATGLLGIFTCSTAGIWDAGSTTALVA